MVKYYKDIFITEDHADRLRPVLRWVKEAAPRVRERRLASSLLHNIRRVVDWKQIALTKAEYELLAAVNLAFPEGATPEGYQYSLPISSEKEEVPEKEPTPKTTTKPIEWRGAFPDDTQGRCSKCPVWVTTTDRKGRPACLEHGGVQ